MCFGFFLVLPVSCSVVRGWTRPSPFAAIMKGRTVHLSCSLAFVFKVGVSCVRLKIVVYTKIICVILLLTTPSHPRVGGIELQLAIGSFGAAIVGAEAHS